MLIVENGSLVAGANSYNSFSQLRDYATARGVTLPAVDAELEILAIKAMDYLESFEGRWKGSRVVITQALSWPREFVYIVGYMSYPGFTDNVIPSQVIRAQAQLVIELHNGLDLMPIRSSGSTLIREKIGPIENEWSPDSETRSPYIPQIDGLLRDFFEFSVNAFALRTVRV